MIGMKSTMRCDAMPHALNSLVLVMTYCITQSMKKYPLLSKDSKYRKIFILQVLNLQATVRVTILYNLSRVS